MINIRVIKNGSIEVPPGNRAGIRSKVLCKVPLVSAPQSVSLPKALRRCLAYWKWVVVKKFSYAVRRCHFLVSEFARLPADDGESRNVENPCHGFLGKF